VKLLDNQSSPRGESSDSINLTQSFIEACKSYNTAITSFSASPLFESKPTKKTFGCHGTLLEIFGNGQSRGRDEQ
jgi:serine kinase of HPr protein (carbohydrate metabolism regulator)